MTPEQEIAWHRWMIIAMIVSYSALFYILDSRLTKLEQSFDGAMLAIAQEAEHAGY